MAAIEINPPPGGDTPGGPQAREQQTIAVPGKIMVLDGGVPWIRSADELNYEWARLKRHGQLIPDGPDLAYADLSGPLRGLIGARATARWCLGYVTRAPYSRRELPVTGANIKSELALAQDVMVRRTGGWEHATGVVMWLLWITGATDDRVYLGW